MMVKQPTFKLYRICSKKTGKSFQSQLRLGEAQWTNLGAFFRSPETIRKHLRYLCHEWHASDRNNMWMPKRGKFLPDVCNDLYVEVYSVLQLEMKTERAGYYLGNDVE